MITLTMQDPVSYLFAVIPSALCGLSEEDTMDTKLAIDMLTIVVTEVCTSLNDPIYRIYSDMEEWYPFLDRRYSSQEVHRFYNLLNFIHVAE